MPTVNNFFNVPDSLVVRQEGHLKAVKFVLASIVHKKDYAKSNLNVNITFKNPNYKKLYDHKFDNLDEMNHFFFKVTICWNSFNKK